MKIKLNHRNGKRRGQGLTEYMILIFLIAIASLSATRLFGDRVQDKIRGATDRIERCLALTSNARSNNCN